MRVPCVMRWAGKILSGRTCDDLVTSMDLLPTLAAVAGARLPAQPIDGHDVRPMIFGAAGASSPWDQEGFCFYFMDQLQAVRAGDWKLYLPLERKRLNLAGKTAAAPAALYDVRHDVGETREVSREHPAVVARLMAMADRARRELGDLDSAGNDQPGGGQRPAGLVEYPTALVPGE